MRGLVKNRSLVSMAFVVGCSLLMTTGKDATLEAQSVVGVWQCPRVPTPWGPADGQTVLMPDGAFTRTVRCGNMFTRDKGTYTVGSGFIHYKIFEHEPKEHGGKPMHWIKEETTLFHSVSPNTIICENSMD